MIAAPSERQRPPTLAEVEAYAEEIDRQAEVNVATARKMNLSRLWTPPVR